MNKQKQELPREAFTTNQAYEEYKAFLKMIEKKGNINTPLKDKNGVEIYEGDLLKRKDVDKPRVVKWTDQNGAYFVLSNSATKKVDWDDCLTDERISIFGYEVIGNIYENPELLERN